MKFEQALQAMRDGQKVRVWDRCYAKYFYLKNGNLYAAHYKRPDEIIKTFDVDYIFSENWVVYIPMEESVRKAAEIMGISKTSHLEKAFEECADKLKQEAVKMVTKMSKEPVKKKNPYYTYNTDIGKGKYKIVFETDDRNGYRQLEEYIRENFIDNPNTASKLPRNAFEMIDEEFEANKNYGIMKYLKSRGYYGDYNLSEKMAIKALIVFLCEICDDKQKQIDDLKNRVGELTAKIDRLHHRLIGGEQDGV